MNSVRSFSGAPRSKLLFHTPAVQAVLIQFSAFLLVLALACGMPLTIAVAALLQGGIAAAISRWRRLAPWWLPIQALFPIALIGTLALRLPPAVFLAAFIMLLGLYWSTFRTQVPFYPSSPAAWEAVAELLPADRPIRLIDIGSGLGGLILHLSARRPESSFIGIELAPLPWLASVLRSRVKRNRARFIRGDYARLDFAAYDVVFAYLSPAAMPALWQKARAEMRKGALLLSYEFPIPGVEPQWRAAPREGGPVLHCWRM
jgi:SAM-dependent methyltransferase